MSQQDILKFLESNPNNFFSAKDIADKLDINITAATKSLKRLRATNWINFKEEKFDDANYKNPMKRFVYGVVKNVS